MLKGAIRRAWGAIALAAFGLLSLPAAGQVMPEGLVLAAADLRGGQDLSGQWNWSIDPYRDGLAGFHGGEAGPSQRRHADTDVASVRRADLSGIREHCRISGTLAGPELFARHPAHGSMASISRQARRSR